MFSAFSEDVITAIYLGDANAASNKHASFDPES